MLSDLRQGLDKIGAIEKSGTPFASHLSESAELCVAVIDRLDETCESIRSAAQALMGHTPDPGEGLIWRPRAQARIARQELPFPNSEICPVSGGVMEPSRFGNAPELDRFASEHLRDYEELDELGSLANEWARALAKSARAIVGPGPPRPRRELL
jgi:hypothetical protein